MASPSTGSNTSQTNSTEEGDAMPHVIVKLWPGKSEQQKRRLTKAITDDVMKMLRYGEESVSVAFARSRRRRMGREDVRPDIVRKPDTLYKEPGYTM